MFPAGAVLVLAALLQSHVFASHQAAYAVPTSVAPPTVSFSPRPGYFPATGDDTIAGGIFCLSLTDLASYLSLTGDNAGATGSESPTGSGAVTSGSGPYPAQMGTDASLPGHTIYAPKTPPPDDVSLPFISFAEGACMETGTAYRNFLTEIASWGYVIAADGSPGGGSGQSKVQESRDAINWAVSGGAKKYGNVSAEDITSMGHSCGGLEAMSVAYHDERVKRIVLLDIAIFQDDRRYLLKELEVPVSWFVGGPKDMGYPNALKDYPLLPEGLPAFMASLDTGHGGTYSATNGGKFGVAIVNYLQWQWRNDTTAKKVLTDPSSAGSLVSQHWNVTFKNWGQ